MNIHESAENYLETILMLKERNGMVRSIDIAHELNYSKPSVSVAMKKLRERNCVTMDDDGYISLTELGMEIASRMYDRHKTLSTWLQQIGVSKDVADEDACKIEHVISRESFLKIKDLVENK